MGEETLLILRLTILNAVPFVLAALGGTCSERGGVVNIALEGMLISGAFATASVSMATGNPWAGLAAGVVAGVLAAALHALLTVVIKVDQIISGLAINLFAAGATHYGMRLIWVGTASKTIAVLPQARPFGDGAAGELANAVFGMPLVVATIVLVGLVTVLLRKTRFGLRLSAVGERPEACDTLGISVWRMRVVGVLLSGGLAGTGGAWLAFNIEQFQHGMSAGKGYIAMAAVVCGKWDPLGATAACLLFGFSIAFAAACERWGIAIPSEIISTLPYVLTIVAVAGLVGRARPPAALGIPYEK